MVHNLKMLNSIEEFLKQHSNDNSSEFELFNQWISENAFDIHDEETLFFYLSVFPLAERRLNYGK